MFERLCKADFNNNLINFGLIKVYQASHQSSSNTFQNIRTQVKCKPHFQPLSCLLCVCVSVWSTTLPHSAGGCVCLRDHSVWDNSENTGRPRHPAAHWGTFFTYRSPCHHELTVDLIQRWTTWEFPKREAKASYCTYTVGREVIVFSLLAVLTTLIFGHRLCDAIKKAVKCQDWQLSHAGD